MRRLFFALWPDDKTRKTIAGVAKRIPIKQGRPVPQGNWHITVAFLGNVAGPVQKSLQLNADRIEASRFSLILDNGGWWKKPKVIWLAPSAVPAELTELVGRVNDVAKACRLPVEERPYRPHLTLARKVRGSPGKIEFEPVTWTINSFSLVESVTAQTGAEYRVLETWPLSSS